MAAHLARQRLPIHERRIRLSHIFRKIKSHHLRHRLRAALVPFAWQLVLVCQTCASAKWARFVVQMGRVERDQLRRGWLTSCRFLGWKELKERENTMTYHDIPWHTMTYRDIPWHTVIYRDIPWHTVTITKFDQIALELPGPERVLNFQSLWNALEFWSFWMSCLIISEVDS